MYFPDRTDAGKKLAKKLLSYKDKNAIVYALPRGGVIVAAEIAQALNAPLSLLISRKIGHPYEPEYAIAAVSENGHLVEDQKELQKVNPDYLKREIQNQRREAMRRKITYLKNTPAISPRGKIAIVVDDGIATGLTVLAALLDLHDQSPRKII